MTVHFKCGWVRTHLGSNGFYCKISSATFNNEIRSWSDLKFSLSPKSPNPSLSPQKTDLKSLLLTPSSTAVDPTNAPALAVDCRRPDEVRALVVDPCRRSSCSRRRSDLADSQISLLLTNLADERSCSRRRPPPTTSAANSSRRTPPNHNNQTKKDDKLRYKMERIPFLEEQVRMIRETGKIMSMDIARLLLSEENRFDFVNEVAAEATEYVENNRDEYGSKKPILHVLSNRMNEAGFSRPEAYLEPDPFKPGPGYLRNELYD
ncbi:uncharacterized protein LOC109821467 [Asparagus officinalis]|uniref:uncharacterized protein LOC109821467 n=1 Tax=Asparagus officinalis TaxID=4686 RepID=UPI00098E78BD|nr:uncharacterized protein LOC109821467 [Asparagus officinalis]